eukprot:499968-Pyramimonas_sp.AAC.1
MRGCTPVPDITSFACSQFIPSSNLGKMRGMSTNRLQSELSSCAGPTSALPLPLTNGFAHH